MNYDIHSLVNDTDFGIIADPSVRCKFVVIASPETTVLVFGPLSRFTYHADIVEAHCATRGLKTTRVGKGDVVKILEPTVIVSGGGYLTWSKEAQTLRLGGSSKAYGHCDLELLQTLLSETRLFAGYRISIEM
jgi:hypothetical protein